MLAVTSVNASTSSGRTTRTVLQALVELSLGNAVVIVADPAAEAIRIAKRIGSMALQLCIPCGNYPQRWPDAPKISARTSDEAPRLVRRNERQPKVLVDHSARHDRGYSAGTRTVITQELPSAS